MKTFPIVMLLLANLSATVWSYVDYLQTSHNSTVYLQDMHSKTQYELAETRLALTDHHLGIMETSVLLRDGHDKLDKAHVYLSDHHVDMFEMLEVSSEDHQILFKYYNGHKHE